MQFNHIWTIRTHQSIGWSQIRKLGNNTKQIITDSNELSILPSWGESLNHVYFFKYVCKINGNFNCDYVQWKTFIKYGINNKAIVIVTTN